MSEMNGIFKDNYWWLQINLTIVLTCICSTFSFVICTKKQSNLTSSVVSNADEMPPRSSFKERHSYPPATYRAGRPPDDITKNPKKTELIRKGLLKVDRKNPNYDTLADIDRELSLRKMDVAQKSQPIREPVYETLCSEITTKPTLPICDEKTVYENRSEIPIRLDSNPKPKASKIADLTIAPYDTETKQQAEGGSTQLLFLVPKVLPKMKPSRQSLISKPFPKLNNDGRPSVVAKCVEKPKLAPEKPKLGFEKLKLMGKIPNLVIEKSVKGELALVKASKQFVGEKSDKPTAPVALKNMWEAIKQADKSSNARKSVPKANSQTEMASQFVLGVNK